VPEVVAAEASRTRQRGSSRIARSDAAALDVCGRRTSCLRRSVYRMACRRAGTVRAGGTQRGKLHGVRRPGANEECPLRCLVRGYPAAGLPVTVETINLRPAWHLRRTSQYPHRLAPNADAIRSGQSGAAFSPYLNVPSQRKRTCPSHNCISQGRRVG
jgi:hypothetical protein